MRCVVAWWVVLPFASAWFRLVAAGDDIIYLTGSLAESAALLTGIYEELLREHGLAFDARE